MVLIDPYRPVANGGFGKANTLHPQRVAPSANAVVRSPPNTNAIDNQSLT